MTPNWLNNKQKKWFKYQIILYNDIQRTDVGEKMAYNSQLLYLYSKWIIIRRWDLFLRSFKSKPLISTPVNNRTTLNALKMESQLNFINQYSTGSTAWMRDVNNAVSVFEIIVHYFELFHFIHSRTIAHSKNVTKRY